MGNRRKNPVTDGSAAANPALLKLPDQLLPNPTSLGDSLRPLAPGESRTKIFGLTLLEGLCKRFDAGFLPYRLYTRPGDFRLEDFNEPTQGRLIVRSDPISPDHVQDSIQWLGMPRLNLTLGNDVEAHQAEVARFMSKAIADKGNVLFIVHKARDLAEYDKNVKIDVDLNAGQARIWVAQISAEGKERENFRNLEQDIRTYGLDADGKIAASGKRHYPSAPEVEGVVKSVVEFAKRTGHHEFNISYVTYRGEPHRPEFYDLMLVRSHSG